MLSIIRHCIRSGVPLGTLHCLTVVKPLLHSAIGFIAHPHVFCFVLLHTALQDYVHTFMFASVCFRRHPIKLSRHPTRSPFAWEVATDVAFCSRTSVCLHTALALLARSENRRGIRAMCHSLAAHGADNVEWLNACVVCRGVGSMWWRCGLFAHEADKRIGVDVLSLFRELLDVS